MSNDRFTLPVLPLLALRSFGLGAKENGNDVKEVTLVKLKSEYMLCYSGVKPPAPPETTAAPLGSTTLPPGATTIPQGSTVSPSRTPPTSAAGGGEGGGGGETQGKRPFCQSLRNV